MDLWDESGETKSPGGDVMKPPMVDRVLFLPSLSVVKVCSHSATTNSTPIADT